MPNYDRNLEGEALLEQLLSLPENEALALYSSLTPRLKWLARRQTTGQRREAIITHHLVIRDRNGQGNW